MGRSRAVLAVCALALVCAGGSTAARADSPTTQELMITVSDGVQLSCGLVLPAGSPPAGGWPGVLLFPGSGQAHSTMEALAIGAFAPAGLASLACDERGTGASGGEFDLAGPADVQDVRDLFAWFAARPEVSDSEIGAYGESFGGAEVWNAAVAGVPFKAIVPAITWTDLTKALVANGVAKVGEIRYFGGLVPRMWDSSLTQAQSDLAGGAVTAAAEAALAARSSRSRLHSLSVPTLLVQARQDLFFDLDQARTAYQLLAGPKRLYIGDAAHALPEVTAWFEHYLAGGKAVSGGIELAHDPWDGTTTSYRGLPPTRSASVNLPGSTTLSADGSVRRSARLTGGPLETFGGGSVSVRYTGAKSWTQLVAAVFVKGSAAPVTEGAAAITSPSGVLTIPFMDDAVVLPRGKPLVVKIGRSSADGIFQAESSWRASIRIERVTLELSVLQRAVSR